MNTDCKDCRKIPSLQPVILETEHYIVWLPKNQAWLGRVCIHLREHKSSLYELSNEEWQELKEIINKLEPAYQKAFKAKPINWGCYMNNAFRDDPAYPHVHWHAFPRYAKPQTINGIVFEDKLYGEHYNPNDEKIVDNETLQLIAQSLKSALVI